VLRAHVGDESILYSTQQKEMEMTTEMSSKWIALLGLLAVAGYKNRDKIAEMLGSRTPATAGGPGEIAHKDAPGGLGGLLGGASAGGVLSGGLRDLIDRFKGKGQADVADSWVRTGPNKELRPDQLEQAIGADALNTLTRQTGLSREELLDRLSRDLPAAVDTFTPDGRLPSEDEAERLITRRA
jgi:uncharacterized protein YidB (DUF937 family)